MDPCAINYGVVIENFPAGEVGAIVLDFSDHLVYKVPMSFFESKEDRFKLGDNVIFCLAPKSNIIAHCERNRNFFANNNSIQVEKSITMEDTVFFSNENPPRVYSHIAGYLQFELEPWKAVMRNVPYKAVIEINIDYGMDFIPANFKLATFNPTVEFWLYDILSVNMQETESVQQLEWNKHAENATYVEAPTAIVDEEVKMFPEVKVENRKRDNTKVRKDNCILLERGMFYAFDGTTIYNPLPGNAIIGTYGRVTYYRCKFNNNVRVAGKFQEVGQVPTRQSSSGIQFLLDLGARKDGFYSNDFVPIVGDPGRLLNRIDTKTSPKQAWVNYESRRDIFRKFTVVEVPHLTTGVLNSIESSGFVKNSHGEVYSSEYFDVEFRLSKDLMGKHKLGDFMEFTAIFRPKKNCFVIKTTETGARYKRLTVGTVTATNGTQSYAFHVPLGRVSKYMLQSDAVGLVEDPSGVICEALFGFAPVELAPRTFWVAFDETGVVPLRVITEKDEVTVAEIKDNFKLYLELPKDYYDSDDDVPQNPMIQKLVQRFG